MKTSKLNTAFSNITFALLFGFSCFFMMNSEKMPSFFNDSSLKFIAAKSFLPIILTIIGVLFCYKQNKGFSFLSLCAPAIIVAQTLFFVIDRYTLKIYGATLILLGIHIFYFLVAVFTFIVCCYFLNKRASNVGYNVLVNRFMKAFAFCYVALILVFMLRSPNGGGFSKSINLSLGKDTIVMLKSFINLGYIESGYVFFGNIVFFVPFGVLLPYFLKSKKTVLHILIGLFVPILYEIYQFIFNCGDVDIDDVVLNFVGFLIGYTLFCLFGGKKIEKYTKMGK